MHLHINMYRSGAYSGWEVTAAIILSLWAALTLQKNPNYTQYWTAGGWGGCRKLLEVILFRCSGHF